MRKKNMVDPDRPQITKCRMGFNCCIHKGYRFTRRVWNSYCYPRQQWLLEDSTILRHTYIAVLFYLIFIFDHHHNHNHHQSVLGNDRPVSALSNCLFKGLPSRLRFFGLYYQTLLRIWYYELWWQVWDLNCSDCWYAGLKICISTLLRQFIPVVFAVQSAVQCIQFKHKNLFIDLYLS